MAAGFLVIGVAAGLVAAALVLIAGHGLWLAAAAYCAGGIAGMGLGVGLALSGPRAAAEEARVRV